MDFIKHLVNSKFSKIRFISSCHFDFLKKFNHINYFQYLFDLLFYQTFIFTFQYPFD